jgi:hypothetical protein
LTKNKLNFFAKYWKNGQIFAPLLSKFAKNAIVTKKFNQEKARQILSFLYLRLFKMCFAYITF